MHIHTNARSFAVLPSLSLGTDAYFDLCKVKTTNPQRQCGPIRSPIILLADSNITRISFPTLYSSSPIYEVQRQYFVDIEALITAYLWCEVEPQEAVVAQAVFHQKRDLVAEAELHRLAESTSLAEVGEVFEGEGKGDGLGEVDLHVLVFILDVGVLAECYGAVTDVAVALEADAVLCAFDGN
jgi:hypothetical protein